MKRTVFWLLVAVVVVWSNCNAAAADTSSDANLATVAQADSWDCERYREIFGEGVSAQAGGKTYVCVWTGWDTRWRWQEVKKDRNPMDCGGYGTSTTGYDAEKYLYYCNTNLRWVKVVDFLNFMPGEFHEGVWGGTMRRDDYGGIYHIQLDLPGAGHGFGVGKFSGVYEELWSFEVDSNHAVVIDVLPWPEGDLLTVGLVSW